MPTPHHNCLTKSTPQQELPAPSILLSLPAPTRPSRSTGSYSGVNNTTPVDTSHGQLNTSSNNVDNTGVTTTSSNDMLVYAAGVVQSTSVVPPSGFSEGSYSASNSLTASEVSNKI